MTEQKKRVKRLHPDLAKDLDEKNEARRALDLRPLQVKVRTCVACGALFESLGNRTCGCNPTRR